jgi:cytochrome c peroxidase
MKKFGTFIKYLASATLVILLMGMFLVSCEPDPPVDPVDSFVYNPTPFDLRVPRGFQTPYLSDENPLTVEGVALGRMLYYDPILSTTGLSCSSCHQPANSFSSPMVTLFGIAKSVPPHVNLAWNPNYNWNGSEDVLDHLPLGDFEPEVFDTDFDKLFADLKAHPKYPLMFREAFNHKVEELSVDELKMDISHAIVQFARTLVSGDSRFDKAMRGDIEPTDAEYRGYQLFFTEKGDCFHCHPVYLFTDNQFHNNGLNDEFEGVNRGRFEVTGNPADIGLFSTPTLRNLVYTAPYMHDGRFATLEEVVEFYNSKVQPSPTLDGVMMKPGKEFGLQLSEGEKADLVAFLKMLTDEDFMNNPDYQNPH